MITNKNKEVEKGSQVEFGENGKCGLELIATGFTLCHLVGNHQQILGNKELKFRLEDRTRNRTVVIKREASLKNVNYKLDDESRRKLL